MTAKTALYRSPITIIAPAVMLASFIYHPHVGNPIDADFLEKLEFRTGNEMWDWVTNSNPIVLHMIAGLTDSQKEKVQQALDDTLREHSDGSSPAVLKAAVNIGTGTR